MPRKSNAPLPIHDDIDRLLLQVHKVICKLVVIAGADTDAYGAERALDALLELGSLAGVPVATVVEHIASEQRRRLMVEMLREIPPRFGLEVFRLLMRVATNDPSEEVRAVANEVWGVHRRRSHERSQRLGEWREARDRIMGRLPAPKTAAEEGG